MDSMVMERPVVAPAGRGRIRRRDDAVASWLAFAVSVLILLVLLPIFAGAASEKPTAEPRPLPAPAGALLPVIDFPERAQPWGACTALVEHSAAIDNARSDRANALTVVLYQDACFEA